MRSALSNLNLQVLIGVSIAIVLSFLIGALPILIGGSSASLIGGKETSMLNIAYSIVTNLIFIGTFEELIFLRYVQTRINQLTNRPFASVLIAAALFVLWHIINGFCMQVIFTFFIGSVLDFAAYT